MNRRLADFIRAEMESILQAWEDFAKTILQARYLGKVGLRDHAREMLLEIAVILTGAKQRKDVESVAQMIIDALAKPFQVAQQPVQIAVSIGITLYPEDASSPIALLETADQAMYKAKKSGSNRICFYDSSDQKDRNFA